MSDLVVTVPKGLWLDWIAEVLGAEAADHAFETSKSAIESAIAAAHARAGIKRQVSPTTRRVLARLYEAGAIVEEPVVHVHAHHPVDAPLVALVLKALERTGT